MSTNIETNVVELKLDNKDFEKNAKKSSKTIDKLKDKLNFEDSKKSFEALERSTRNLTFDSLANSIANIEKRFTTMGIVATTAISKITSSMLNLGVSITKNITSQIISGGVTRAFKLEQARFMMQGLLKDTKAVNAVMKNVNDSVDGTAYGLDSAANVASQFAATGMRAGKEMEGALKGVAGVAAMTGSDYESIGQIFTTVAGNGRLMGDQLLQLSTRGLNAASVITKYLNKTTHGVQYNEQQIRDAVSRGKVSFELFSKAMQDAFGKHAKEANKTFTGAMANVKSALSRIGALFTSPLIKENGPLVKFLNVVREKINDIKKSLEPVSKKIMKNINSGFTTLSKHLKELDFTNFIKDIGLTNSYLYKLLRVLGTSRFGPGDDVRGWDFLLGSIKNIVHYLGQFKKVISSAWKEIFPPATTKQIWKALLGFEKLTSKLNLSNKTAKQLKRIFKGVFALFDIGLSAVKALFGMFGKLNKEFGDTGDGLLELLAKFGDFVVSLRDAIKEGNAFERILDTILYIIKPLIKYVSELFSSFANGVELPKVNSDKFNMGLTTVLHAIRYVTDKIYSFLTFIKDNVKGFFNDLFTFENLDRVADAGIMALMARLLLFVGRLVKSLNKGVQKVTSVLNAVEKCLLSYQQSIKADILKKIAVSILMLSGAVYVLTQVDTDKLGYAVAAIGALGTILVLLFKALNKAPKASKKAEEVKKITDTIKETVEEGGRLESLTNQLFKIAGAIVVVAFGLKVVGSALIKFAEVSSILGKMKVQDWLQGFGSLILLLGAVVGLCYVLGKYGDNIKETGHVLMAIAVSFVVLGAAVAIIGNMPIKVVVQGFVALLALFGMLTGFLVMVKEWKDIAVKMAIMTKCMEDMATGMLKLSVSVALLAIIAHKFPEGFAKSMASLAAYMGILVGSALLLSGKDMTSMHELAYIIQEFTICFIALTGAMYAFNYIDWASLGKAAAVLGGLYLFLIGTATIVKILDDIIGNGGLSSIIHQLTVDIATLCIGLVGLSTALLIMTQVFKNDKDGETFKKIAQALVAVIGGIIALSVVLNRFPGAVNGGGLQAVVTLFDQLANVVIKVSLGVAAVGAAAYLASAGIKLFGTVAGATIVSFLKFLSTGIKVIALTIPFVAQMLGEGIAMFIYGFVSRMPEILASVAIVLEGILSVVNNYAQPLVETAIKLLMYLMQKLITYTPKLVEAIANWIVATFAALSTHVPRLVKAGFDLIGEIIDGIIQALNQTSPDAILKTIGCIGAITALIVAFNFIGPMIPTAMLVAVGVSAFIAELIGLLSLLTLLEDLGPALDVASVLLEKLGNCIGSFIGGILGGIARGFVNQLPAMAESLSKFMNSIQGFINGAKEIPLSIIEKIHYLGDTMDEMADVVNGWSIDTDKFTEFNNQIYLFAGMFRNFSNAIYNIPEDIIEHTQRFAEAATALFDMAEKAPSSGGLFELFTGNNDIDAFGWELQSFGNAMVRFKNATEGLDKDDIKGAAEAGIELMKMADEVPKHDGALQFFTGDNHLDVFGWELQKFGNSIVQFANTTKDLKKNVIDNATACGKTVAVLQDTIPNAGGLIGMFSGNGEDKIKNFGLNLEELGRSLSVISNLDIDKEGLQVMVDACAELRKVGELDTDSDNIEDLAEDVSGFIESINENLSAVDFNSDNVQKIADSINKLTSPLAYVTSADIREFGLALQSFGRSFHVLVEQINSEKLDDAKISKYIKAITDISSKTVKSAESSFENSQEQTKNIGLGFVGKLIEGIKSGFSKLKDAFADVGDAIKIKFDSSLDKASGSINKSIKKSAKSIKKGGKTYKNAAKKSGIDINKGVNVVKSTVVKGAQNLGSGLADTMAKSGKNWKSAAKAQVTNSATYTSALKKGADQTVEESRKSKEKSKETASNISIAGDNQLKGAQDYATKVGQATTLMNQADKNAGKKSKKGKKTKQNQNGKSGKNGKNGVSFDDPVSADFYNDTHGTSDKGLDLSKNNKISAKSVNSTSADKIITKPSRKQLISIGESVSAGIAYGIDKSASKIKKSTKNALALGSKAVREVQKSLQKGGSIFSEYLDKSTQSDAKSARKQAQSERKDLEKQRAEAVKQRNKSLKEKQLLDKQIADGNTQITEQQKKTAKNNLSESKKSVKEIDKQLAQNSKNLSKASAGTKITLKQAAEAYLAYRDAIKESLKGVSDSFDGFTVDQAYTTKELLKNLKSTSKGMDEWIRSITILQAKGVDKKIIKKLATMGPEESLKIMRGLTTASAKEIKQFNKLWLGNQQKAKTYADVAASGALKVAKKSKQVVKSGMEDISMIAGQSVNMSKWSQKTAGKISDILTYTFEDTKKKVRNTMAFGRREFNTYLKQFSKDQLNGLFIKNGKKVLNNAKKIILNYGKYLYKEQNKEEAENYEKSIKALKKRENYLKKHHKKGTDEYKSVHEQRLAIQQEYLDKQKEAYESTYESIKKTIIDYTSIKNLKFDNNLSGIFNKLEDDSYTAYVNAKDNVDKLKVDADNAKKAYEDAAKNQTTVAQRLKASQLWEQYQKAQEAYEDAKNEFDSMEKTTSSSILENMQKQNKASDDFDSYIERLKSMGYDKELINEIEDMGYESGMAYAKALVNGEKDKDAITKETKKYLEKSSKKSAQAWIKRFDKVSDNEKMYKELLAKNFDPKMLKEILDEGVDEANSTFKGLLNLSAADQNQLKNKFANQMKFATNVASQITTDTATSLSSGLHDGVEQFMASDEKMSSEEKLNKLGDMIKNVVDADKCKGNITANIKTALLSGFQAVGEGKDDIKAQLMNKLTQPGGAARKAKSAIIETFEKMDYKKELSKSIASGVANSIDAKKLSKKEKKKLKKQIVKYLNDILSAKEEAARDVSKAKKKDNSTTNPEYLTNTNFTAPKTKGAQAAKKAARTIMSAFSGEVEANTSSPTISPVVDMDSVDNIDLNSVGCDLTVELERAYGLSERFAEQRAYNNKVLNSLDTIIGRMREMDTGSIVTNNINMSVDGSKGAIATADEISRTLQTQVERRVAVWA